MARSSNRTTERGFVNRNRQKNNGATDPPLPGSDHNQIIYKMECLVCGHRYGANSSHIWQRKCPRCQRGAEGLALGVTGAHERYASPPPPKRLDALGAGCEAWEAEINARVAALYGL